jgi:Uncharacterized conserved protein
MGAVMIQEGGTIDYTPGSDLSAGAVVVQGELVGVLVSDTASGKLGALAVEGVFDFNKASGGSTAITAGALVYYDVAEDVAKTNSESSANKLIGKTIAAAGDSATKVRVKLSQ